MIESEIVALGSVKGVLSGKHYNCCIHTHLAIFEAMERLRLRSFEKSLTTAERAVLDAINSAYSANPDNFEAISFGNDVANMKMMYDKFIKNSLRGKSVVCLLVELHRDGADIVVVHTCNKDICLGPTPELIKVYDSVVFFL